MLRQAQYEEAGKSANGKPGMRARWRHSRSILKEGLEAALRADPEVLEKCKPKTGYGALVRGLILEAAKCKATPLKTLMALIDWQDEDDRDEDRDVADEDRRDWSPDGVWETMPAAAPEPEPVDAANEAAKAEVKRRLTRMLEAGQHEHVARIVDAIRSGAYAEPAPVPTG